MRSSGDSGRFEAGLWVSLWPPPEKVVHVERIDAVFDEYEWELEGPFYAEVRIFKRALGPLAIAGLRAYGYSIPKSREELDELMDGVADGILK